MARAGRKPASSVIAARAGLRSARRRVTSLARVLVNAVATVVRRREEREVRRDALVVQVHAVAYMGVDVVLAPGHAHDQVRHVVVRPAAVREAGGLWSGDARRVVGQRAEPLDRVGRGRGHRTIEAETLRVSGLADVLIY